MITVQNCIMRCSDQNVEYFQFYFEQCQFTILIFVFIEIGKYAKVKIS